MEFPIVLDAKSQDRLFIQLSKVLKERIIAGTLPAGAALPPTRELADALGVSRGTVVKAYEDLVAQGYIDAIKGSGTFVSKRGQVELNAQKESERRRSTPAITTNAYLSGDARKLLEMSLSEGIAGYQKELNYGAPPADMLPLRQWKEILIGQCRQQQPHHFDCTPETLGHYRLRVELASYLARSKGLNCQPQQVIVFPGSQQALTYIAKILIDSGDTVIVENPGYGGARDIFKERKAHVLPIGIDHDGIKVHQFDRIERSVKLVYVTPSYQDPTGAIMSLDRRKALLEWASRQDAIVVEDGWDSDYSYVSQPLPSLQGLDNENRVIYLYSFWKVLYPLTTVGCAVVPRSLIPIFDRVKFLTERQFPILEHYTLAEFLKSGGYSLQIKRSKLQFEKRRKALTEAFLSAFKREVEIPKQSAGLHLCIRIAPSLLSRGFELAAREAGIPLVSTAPYYAEAPRHDEFLTPFAAFTDEEIKTRVQSLSRAMK